MHQRVILLDFGSQYTQLIARRVRELNIFCEIRPYHDVNDIEWGTVQAVILSGSPFSVRADSPLLFSLDLLLGKVPILAICYGAQLIAHQLGGRVEASQKREYGKAQLQDLSDDPLWKGVQPHSQVWMSHADTIYTLPDSMMSIGATRSIQYAAYRSRPDAFGQPVYGLQFHPEVAHSLEGLAMMRNFLYDICGCKGDWTPAAFVEETVAVLQQQIGNEKVLLALSGGVDSTVAAVLLQKAIGDQLLCYFVDNGLLRKDEFSEVLHSYKDMGLNIEGVHASQRFWDALTGIKDPEKKRKVIGNLFIKIFEEEAEAHPEVQWLAQGTIYPDVIESVSVKGPSATIKSHHNVGGLPDNMSLKIVEPLRMLFKDEVRRVGRELGINEAILSRHPFPGPGLGIRILGDVTPERVHLLQEADAIFVSKLKEHNLYAGVWQCGAILLPVQAVGVMGDERTYEQVVALRAVNSTDGMTAEWSRLPYDFLAEVSTEIINQVKGINRVVYDISTKPPATIEWE